MKASQDLMYSANSPILDFYPQMFEQDLNGKKQDWEAVVKIPFIDNRLLDAMQLANAAAVTRASANCGREAQNGFRSSTRFMYSQGEPTHYPSSLFPTVVSALRVSRLLRPSVLGVHGVNVRGTESWNKWMVLHMSTVKLRTCHMAREIFGTRTFVGWPFYRRRWSSRCPTRYSRMERLETGALVKDYEGLDKEQEHAAFLRWRRRILVSSSRSLLLYLRNSQREVADMLGMSERAVTSSFLVITADNQKTNLGLSLKFDAKALKVIDYSQKDQRQWGSARESNRSDTGALSASSLAAELTITRAALPKVPAFFLAAKKSELTLFAERRPLVPLGPDSPFAAAFSVSSLLAAERATVPTRWLLSLEIQDVRIGYGSLNEPNRGVGDSDGIDGGEI
ncbi:hypothetical protein GGX14DRAFT_405055 [Mycena pura]|uniref:Uncharacterized protein n=1 Tax=Mycena pura TaxID=153505 RepID=A0AAD6Y0W2_9AGAR|nr:hypothetical protein GGX14DRAFT_405055 [Mycena pura]